MAIDRTNYNALVDDDGSNLVGTLWTKNIVKTVLLDPIDADLALKATLASPALTGTPTAPTAAAATNTTQLATTAMVQAAIAAAGGGGGVTGSVQGSAFHNTTQSLANATFTALNFNSEDYQVGALHSTSVNNSRVTIATTGKYLFVVTVCFVPNATGQRIIVGKVNGTTFFDKLDFPTNGTQTFEAQLSKLIALTAGDYVEIFAFQDSGGSLNVGDATNRYSQNAVAWIRMT